MKSSPLFALFALTMGCGGEDGEPAPAQPPVSGCDVHELALVDGTCQRPGVPLDGCAEGFVHDGSYGCEPLLPAEPCPPGLMALPGDTDCRPIMDCGTGTWGNLPIDGLTQHVDGAYAGGDGDGSAAKPWPGIQQAVAAAAPGALIAVAAGTYNEDVVIDGKPVRLWGVCPAQVTIVGSGQQTATCPPAAVCVAAGADGAEVGGVALTGAGPGMMISGSVGVLIDRVHVHDNAGRGIDATSILGPTSIEVRGALIEQNHDIGLVVFGSEALVDTSLVRGTLPRVSDQTFGWGIGAVPLCVAAQGGVYCDPAARSIATVQRSLIEQNHEVGVSVSGSDLTLDASVVRATWPRAADQTLGRGVSIQLACIDTPEGLQCDPAARGHGTLRRSLIEQNHDYGLFVMGSDGTVETSVVRETWPRAADQTFGYGIGIQLACMDKPTGLECDVAAPSVATVGHTLVENNHDVGLVVSGAEATVEASVVRATWPRAADQTFGRGLSIQLACVDTPEGLQCDPAGGSSASLHGTLIEQNHDIGLLVMGSAATVEASVVRATWPRAADDLFGDGIAVVQRTQDTSTTVTNTVIADSARAGLSNFSAFVSLGSTSIQCAAFALDGESTDGAKDAEFDDRGGNACGCPVANDACKAVSTGLQPPDPLATGG